MFKITPVVLAAFSAIFLLLTLRTEAATFTVTNTNDSGAGSLRQAILDAQALGGVDTIAFNIPGGGVKKIVPQTALPNVGANHIDGTTQPGWSVGNLLIEISGENLTATDSKGITFNGVPGSSPSIFVRGLIVNRFNGSGIYIQDSQNVTVEGCYIGTDASGSIDLGNRNGVEIRAASGFTQNNTIGGTTAAQRNVISGNLTGINTFGGNGFFIKGNHIGTDASGNLAVPNGNGISLLSQDCIVGGTSTAERNVISGNSLHGILVTNSNNVVQNNYIGVGADGFTELGNKRQGITINNSINLVNRGDHQILQNTIAHNQSGGIEITTSALLPDGIKISNNSIFDNGFGIQLGIDLNDDGVTPNDVGDADTGTNNLQNYPVMTSAVSTLTNTALSGTFNSEPNTSYRIEYYANDSNRSEGKTQIFVQNITTDAGGNATINVTVPFASHHGQFVTATATRNAAPFDTSEFSVPVAVSVTTFTVTNTNDSGAGSLRQAIIDSNASADGNLIDFAITPLNGTVKTINLTSPLPAITNPVTIDGLTQNGASCNSPKVELNGTSAGAGGDGFNVTGNDTTIRGLVINRFLGDGIILDGLRNTITCNRIGTNADGNADLGNGGRGIFLDVSHFNLITDNTISGNTSSGILGSISQFNKIKGNIIGLSSDGTTIIGNGQGGIAIAGGFSNIIGDTTDNERNVISGNGLAGIIIAATSFSNGVKGNYIGINSSGGGTAFGNTGPGILITTNAGNNVVGGTETGAENVIAHNAGEGITVVSGTGNRFLRNEIHDNALIGIDLGDNGVTANDLDDVDTGANDLQNFPVLSNAEAFFAGLKVIGSLNSTGNTSYRIEVYSNASCDGTNGEGRTFVGSFEVTTDAGGDAAFNQNLAGVGVTVGEAITATATRLTAPFDTSEFSACRTATALTGVTTLTVTNTNDSGSGSFREIINTANSNADLNVIRFNISGTGVKTITPTTALPAISQPVILDGLSQTGATCEAPLIELNGTNTTGVNGLTISGSADVRGLIINRFDGNGIEFRTKGSNSVKCSFIGVSSDGLSPSRNGHNGLYFNAVSNNTVGGPNSDGNVISCNSQANPPGFNFDAGIHFFLSTDNVVQGNIIGLNKNGLITTTFLSNRQENGITLLNADSTLIGGKTAAERNIIAGNDTSGIYLQNSDGNVLTGNYIGLDINGTTSGASTTLNGSGIDVGFSDGNQIGGAETGEGNVISANGEGINIHADSTETVVHGNIIGVAPGGNSTVGITQTIGIVVSSSSTAIIGGRTSAERNVISGHQTGIRITNFDNAGGIPFAVIEGNYLGLGADGTTVLSNGLSGVLLEGLANGNIIGGTAPGAGNVFAGNGSKIKLDSSNNLIQGNLIGTNASGTVDASAFGVGIELLANGTNNTIGGSNPATRNVISGVTDGIKTATGVTTANGNLIQNNLIGTAIDGTTALPNSSNGILLESSNNTIANNTIAFNAQTGIVILPNGTGNRISANSIFSNGTTAAHLGIDLGNDGVTNNDTGDGDLANNLQNYPVLLTANAATVTGTLNSTANTQFTLEFFISPTADPSNFGEGRTYLGSMPVSTNGNGDASFSFTSSLMLTDGHFVTATATRNSTGDTSEFSQVKLVVAPTAANASIEGRIVTESGMSVPRASVALVGPDGVLRMTQTNPFGYFRFVDLPVGSDYVMSVSHKSMVFEPSTFIVSLYEDINDLTIIGVRRLAPETEPVEKPD